MCLVHRCRFFFHSYDTEVYSLVYLSEEHWGSTMAPQELAVTWCHSIEIQNATLFMFWVGNIIIIFIQSTLLRMLPQNVSKMCFRNLRCSNKPCLGRMWVTLIPVRKLTAKFRNYYAKCMVRVRIGECRYFGVFLKLKFRNIQQGIACCWIFSEGTLSVLCIYPYK